MAASVVVIGPMAPILARGVEAVATVDGTLTVRRCDDWARLGLSVVREDVAFVVVGVDDDFDRERAFELSVECPGARIIVCELHRSELSVMRAGRAQTAGAASMAQLAAILGCDAGARVA